MVRTESTIMPAGSKAPAFTLPDTRNNHPVSLSDYASAPLVIVFMCNHCPYVVHIVDALADVTRDFATQGVQSVAISANDIVNYPDDSPANMALLAEKMDFNFPYLFDEAQTVAKAYDAVCTPDIYLFDADHTLFYRGQFDDSRPGRGA